MKFGEFRVFSVFEFGGEKQIDLAQGPRHTNSPFRYWASPRPARVLRGLPGRRPEQRTVD